MKRIYTNYSESEYNLICLESKKLGLSPSAYVKYKSLLGLSDLNTYDLVELFNKMSFELENMEPKKEFIVSSLVPDEWVSLTRSQKMILSKKLSNYVNENPSKFERCEEKLSDKTTQYRKLR